MTDFNQIYMVNLEKKVKWPINQNGHWPKTVTVDRTGYWTSYSKWMPIFYSDWGEWLQIMQKETKLGTDKSNLAPVVGWYI